MKQCPLCTAEFPDTARTCPHDGVVLIGRRELEPGTIFRDTYRIVRVLGTGGMGIVYLAEHLLLGQLRALKFLASELASNPAALQRFLREAKRAAEIGLNQPNIVQTLEAGQGEDGSFFLCMEYVDGPSLAALMGQAPRGLPEERAFAIVRGIASGLAAAHAKGMVHRDIKPGNILLGISHGEEVAKIADFGIVTGAETDSQLTRTGLQPLTPEYASPEQWKGVIPGKDLDGRTDLYALGCVFFEMLTGRTPFQGMNAEQLREMHLHTAPPTPSSLRPELRRYPVLDAVVLRLLSKAREERPKDVRTFLAELDQAITSRPREIFPHELKKRETVAEKPALPVKNADLANTGEKVVPKQSWFRRKRRALRVVAGIVAAIVIGLSATFTSDLEVRPVWQTAACNAGNANACLHAGWAYSYREKDPARALISYTKACDGGNAEGCVDLGDMYKDGEGVEKDHPRAATLFTRGCDGGNNRSCMDLGRMYEDGDGVAQDYPRAATLYQKDCDEGDQWGGCLYLGWMYELSKGVGQNYARAAGLFRKSCDDDNDFGCGELGDMYRIGEGVPKDDGKARDLLTKACNRLDSVACDNLKKM